MKPIILVGILLIAIGLVSLAYQGFSYTTEEKILDIGPIEATTETKKRVPIPPLVGGLALLSGVVLLVMGSRKTGS